LAGPESHGTPLRCGHLSAAKPALRKFAKQKRQPNLLKRIDFLFEQELGSKKIEFHMPPRHHQNIASDGANSGE
jgi:hypothetical protein